MYPKISVIIPVYNVETYLKECLDSILSQDLIDIEIICVNDGSTDSSLAILESYAVQDQRMTIINQENQGISRTRNAGLKKAKGDYIFLPDSDDYLLQKNALSLLYSIASEHNLDIVSFNFATVGHEEKEYYLKRKDNHIHNGKMFLLNGDATVMVWDKFYKREYLHSIHFTYNEIIAFHEDDEALPRIYVDANKVIHINNILYAYRKRDSSITMKPISIKNITSVKIILETYNKLFQLESDIYFQKYLKKRIFIYLMIYYHFLIQVNEDIEAFNTYENIKNNFALSYFEVFLLKNEEKFIQYTRVNLKHKFTHPLVYLIRKLRKSLYIHYSA